MTRQAPRIDSDSRRSYKAVSTRPIPLRVEQDLDRVRSRGDLDDQYGNPHVLGVRGALRQRWVRRVSYGIARRELNARRRVEEGNLHNFAL